MAEAPTADKPGFAPDGPEGCAQKPGHVPIRSSVSASVARGHSIRPDALFTVRGVTGESGPGA